MAILAMSDYEQQTRKTYENIYYPLKRWPCTKQHIDDVPITPCKSTEPNEPPIKRTDNDKNEGCYVKSFHKMKYI